MQLANNFTLQYHAKKTHKFKDLEKGEDDFGATLGLN